MNILKKINSKLAEVYQSKDAEYQMVSLLSFYVSFILAILALLIGIIIKSVGAEKIIILSFSFVFFINILLILKGRAAFASLALTYFLSITLSLIIFSNPHTSGFTEFYMIGFLNIFIISLTAFIGFYPWQSIPIVIINMIAVIANFILRSKAHDIAIGRGPQYDDLVITCVLTLFAS